MTRTRASCNVVVVLCLAMLLGAGSAPAGAVPPDRAEEVRQAVRDYLAAIDAGELDRQMAFWSGAPDVTSVIMGEVWTGLEAIRAQSATYVPASRLIRNELGEVRVIELGPDVALSITAYRPVRRDPANEKLKPFELDSMLTLIWKRVPEGWRIVHEHVSVKVPPPTVS